MNYLAHLHLANHCHSHLAGNLMADFVRGDPYPHFPREVADGIRFHRYIDSFIDQLPQVRQCKHLFSPENRRVSAIALDIAWDHFLALHWQHYHIHPLHHFVTFARNEVQSYGGPQPKPYTQAVTRMWNEEWLLQYQYPEVIGKTLARLAERRPKLSQLQYCAQDIEQHYGDLEQVFFQIYPILMEQAQRIRAQI